MIAFDMGPVRGSTDLNNQNMGFTEKPKGGINEKWEIIYVDEWASK